MAVYNYTVSEFNPAEVPAGGMIACHAPLFHFDLHDGDKDLYFISGQISNAVDGSMYTLVNGHFTDLVEGWFEVAIPTTVTAGEYSVFAYFGALDYHVADRGAIPPQVTGATEATEAKEGVTKERVKSASAQSIQGESDNYYQFNSSEFTFEVTSFGEEARMTNLLPSQSTVDAARLKIYAVPGYNLDKAEDFALRKMSGPGLAQLYIMANVHNRDMFSFRILTPENLLEAGGQYRLQARSKVTGNIIYAPKFLIFTEDA